MLEADCKTDTSNEGIVLHYIDWIDWRLREAVKVDMMAIGPRERWTAI